MNWIFLALASNFGWASVNVADKYLVSNKVKDPYVYVVWLTMIDILVVFAIPFLGLQIPSLEIMGLIVLAAILNIAAAFPYIKAVHLEDVTRLNVLWTFIPIFTLVMGWVFLDEKLNGMQMVAFGVLIVGAVLASLRVKSAGIKVSEALWLMIVSSFGYAAYAVLIRHITQNFPFVDTYIWGHLFSLPLVMLMLFIPKFRKSFVSETKTLSKKVVGIVGGIWVVDSLAFFFSMWALSLGPAALVFSLEGFSPLFAFLLVLSVSLFTKIDLREDLDKRNVAMKMAAIVVMFAGLIILNANS